MGVWVPGRESQQEGWRAPGPYINKFVQINFFFFLKTNYEIFPLKISHDNKSQRKENKIGSHSAV